MNGFGGIGGWELLLVAVIAMLVLGPEHMVKHAYKLGRWARELSRYWHEGMTAFREQLKDIEEEAVGDRSDLPNLSELNDLAVKLRIDESLTSSASAQTMRPEPENGISDKDTAEVSSSDDPNIAVNKPTSYSAWSVPNKPTG